MSAATDCPACPDCGLPCGTFISAEDHGLRDGRIMCAACGHDWRPSEREAARARAADAAYLAGLAEGQP